MRYIYQIWDTIKNILNEAFWQAPTIIICIYWMMTMFYIRRCRTSQTAFSLKKAYKISWVPLYRIVFVWCVNKTFRLTCTDHGIGNDSMMYKCNTQKGRRYQIQKQTVKQDLQLRLHDSFVVCLKWIS